MSTTYDLVVVGVGAAGLAAATFAAEELGLRIATVEREALGGSDRWTGTVPSKALLAAARTRRRTTGDRSAGGHVEIDTADVWAQVREIRQTISDRGPGSDDLDALGIALVRGHARITGAREVSVDTAAGVRTLRSRFVMVCTGSRPAIPAVTGLADVEHLTTDRLYELETPPASIVIVGGGPVGVETAQACNRLGIATTVISAAGRLLDRDEPELADRLATVLRNEGVTVHLGSRVVELRRGRHGITAAADDVEATAEAVLLATGRTANVEHLGLDTFGIRTGPHGIEVDGRSRTIVPSIYAVGDVAAGHHRVAHAAVHDARAAVLDMFLPGRRLAATLVPWCTFTDPELAHAGLTASAARERYGARHVEVYRHEFAGDQRAIASGHTHGALIVVTAKRRIVGAHALAPGAGDWIHELTLAIRLGLRLSDLGELVHVGPTYAGAVGTLATASTSGTRRHRLLARLNRLTG